MTTESSLGTNLDSTAGEQLSQNEVSTIGPEVTLTNSTASTASEFATVEASPQGDIVNGVQTNVNPTPDISNVSVLNTSTIEDYSNANKGLPASSLGVPQRVIPNPLHSYASYTYGLSLHLMTPSDFNNIMSSQNPIYTPTNVLVASAGRYNNANFVRNPAFNDDFYFEDLKLNTVIGLSPINRSTNNVNINFTLIEPNGFSFINRLLHAATVVDAKNYTELPYMLQIDFYGSTDAGNAAAPIPAQTKHIPIMITGIKTKVTTKGTEYRISAAPYSHKSFQESVAATPTNFQIQAATVRDFFGTGYASVDAYNTAYGNSQRVEQLQRELSNAATDAQRADINFQLSQLTDLNQVFTVKDGYANAVNGWYQFLQYKRKRLTLDTVSIVLDPDIGNSLVTVPEQNDIRKVANSTKAEQNAARTAAIGATVGGPKFTEGYYPVPAGMPIDKVIETVIRTSSYITSQIKDPSTDNPESMAQLLGRPLNWFKIVPKVTLGDYDYITGQYAKNYTYYVKKWTVSNKVPVAPMGKASGFVKKYEYIYTGKNSDVLDVNLDFDNMYYIAMTENKVGNQDVMGIKRPDYMSPVNYSIPEIYPTNTGLPKKYVYHSQDMQYSGQFNTTKNPRTLAAADLTKDLIGSARGDMLTVKLTILGDPSFIKQDDVFFNINERFFGQLLTPNGSIIMDDGELYVLLIFKSPTDYDESSGLMRNDQYANWSVWSGIYGITTVESSFSRGKFTQTLELFRLSNQPAYDDLLGGQYSQVLQFQRFEQRVLNAALTPLQGIARDAAGRILGSLSGVLSVVSAAQQIAQNAQAIATGVLSAVVGNAINRATSVAQTWAKDNILTPLEDWAKENVLKPLEDWFTELRSDVSSWFYDTFTSTGDKLYDMFSSAAYVDIASFQANPDVFEWIAGEMGFETFDVVDPGVFDAIDP